MDLRKCGKNVGPEVGHYKSLKFFLTKHLGHVRNFEIKGRRWISFVSIILAVGLIFIGFTTPKSTRCGWLIVKNEI